MVSTKEMRATLKFPTQQDVTVDFTYLGPTQDVSHLADGEVRSQFGVKLRAQDTCNIVYVMWQFAPAQRIAVSVSAIPVNVRMRNAWTAVRSTISSLAFPLPSLPYAQINPTRLPHP
jgi:hypothetical protein